MKRLTPSRGLWWHPAQSRILFYNSSTPFHHNSKISESKPEAPTLGFGNRKRRSVASPSSIIAPDRSGLFRTSTTFRRPSVPVCNPAMGRHERRRRLRLAELLAMASTASAMSLSNFQVITSSSVPLACILAYNNPITGCTANDFTQGQTCSDVCVRNIQRAESTLAAACDGVSAPDTVLGQAILGNLVNILCPKGNPPASTGAVATTTRKILTLTALQPTAIPTTDTSVTTIERVETESPSASQSSPSPPAQEATQIAPPPAESVPLAIDPTQATGAQETSTPSQSTSDGAPGGGSPFDVSAAVSSTSWRLGTPRMGTFLAASALVYLLG